MLKSLDELKSFITWCKSEKVKRLKVGDIEVELSEIALIEDLNSYKDIEENPAELVAANKLEQQQQDAEDESLLFWSAE